VLSIDINVTVLGLRNLIGAAENAKVSISLTSDEQNVIETPTPGEPTADAKDAKDTKEAKDAANKGATTEVANLHSTYMQK